MSEPYTRKVNRKRQRRVKSLGVAPGSLIFEGQRHLEYSQLVTVRYDKEKVNTTCEVSYADVSSTRAQPGHLWVQCTGIHDLEIIKQLGQLFNINSLTLEDILSPFLRPKYESFTDYLYICLKLFNSCADGQQPETEQLSLILGHTFVITFQEKPSNLFDPIMKRLDIKEGRLRQNGPDYLTAALIDAVVDSYFPVIDNLQDRLDYIDSNMVDPSEIGSVQELHSLKRTIYLMNRSISPLREIMKFVSRSEESPFTEFTEPYLRDTHDNILSAIDNLENCREHANNLMDLHFSLQNSRTNEIIRFLTIVSSTFIPLTFVTSIYGMNFKFMPELQWLYGYPAVLALLVFIFIGFAMYCRRRGWL